MSNMLSAVRFAGIVRDTPLISIDLIVSHQGKYLFGRRSFEPAKGYWFVPGGRIRKGENFDKAFDRLTNDELGVHLSLSDAAFHGVYEHHYDTNFSENGDFGTHYVVLAYRLEMPTFPSELPDEQHTAYRWLSEDQIKDDEFIHDYTKDYFNRNQDG